VFWAAGRLLTQERADALRQKRLKDATAAFARTNAAQYSQIFDVVRACASDCMRVRCSPRCLACRVCV
jgi:hypothetical protein